MTFNYAALRDGVVVPQIANFGKDGTLTLNTPATGSDPWNPGSEGETETPVKVVQTEFKLADRDGTLVQKDDLLFLVSTAGQPEIALAKTLTVDGVVYQIVQITSIKPGPVTMLYKVHCRR